MRPNPLSLLASLLLVATSAAAAPSGGAETGALDEAIKAVEGAEYARAERALEAVHGADEAKGKLVLARMMLEQGRVDEALGAAQAASSSRPLRAAAAAVRAQALYAVGRDAEAMRVLEQVKDVVGADGRRVRLLLGEYRIGAGRRADAERPLMAIIDEYNGDAIDDGDAEGLAVTARAAHLLRSPKDANTLFNKSERAGARVETLLWRAELFLDKHDPGHAEEVLRDALAKAPRQADALVLLARVKLEQTLDFDAAERLANEALAVNPRHTGAYAVRAAIALRDLDLAKAEEAVAAGLAANPRNLELWSIRAAARFLADDRRGFEDAKKRTLAQNPEFSRFFGTVSEFAEWEHRYDDIVSMMKEATAVDARDAKAWAQLGLMQLRGGDEPAGLASLRRAWPLDHFNVRVYNTLNLYEQSIPSEYELITADIFKVRYPKRERAVLERYLPTLLGEAWASMKGRYMFTPATPVQVELYGNRQHFGVRTSGLPNIGIQGVCFGRVVAALSPQGEAFNWGNVVWHELAHVFAIQLSNSRVPRWFTEGLSEYETIARRPEWRRELDPPLYAALSEGRLPSAVDMNRAFTRAADGDEMTVAYYASSQMLLFTADTLGMPKIVEALRLWGQGAQTEEVISRAFGLSPGEYDARFRAWALARLARYKGQFFFDGRVKPLSEAQAEVAARPKNAPAQVDAALALLRARKLDEASEAIDAALRLDGRSARAHFVAARLAAARRDPRTARAHLEAIRAAGGDGYTVQMALAEISEAENRIEPLRAALLAAHRFDPTQADPLRALLKLADQEKREADALTLLRALAPIEQHDARVWRRLLARLVEQKAWDEAADVGQAALFVDVESAPLHMLYARALSARGAHDHARFELESALVCPGDAKQRATAHALLARELALLGRPDQAQYHMGEARKLDPAAADAGAGP